MSTQILLEALQRAGVLAGEISQPRETHPLTKLDFYEDGLTGKENSEALRLQLLRQLSLPHYLSANALLQVITLL